MKLNHYETQYYTISGSLKLFMVLNAVYSHNGRFFYIIGKSYSCEVN